MEKPIQKYLAEIFLLVVGTVLGWSLYSQYVLHRIAIKQEKFEVELIRTLERQNELLKNENDYLGKEIEYAVKYELINWGKETNRGLLDTICIILDQRNELFNKEQIDYSNTQNYQRKICEIYNLNAYNPDYQLNSEQIDSLPNIEHATLLRNSILTRERNLLRLLLDKVGNAGCLIPQSRQGFGFAKEAIVVEGDTLHLVLLPDWHINNDLKSSYQHISPEYSSDDGIIIEDNLQQHAELLIPTAGKLKVNETFAIFQYKASAKFYQYGNKYEIPIEGTYKIVRRK